LLWLADAEAKEKDLLSDEVLACMSGNSLPAGGEVEDKESESSDESEDVGDEEECNDDCISDSDDDENCSGQE
jgi:hypothetical protein